MGEQEKAEHIAMVLKHVQVGDTLTHTRCMGCLEEHVYTGMDGPWLCGTPTKDTKRLGGSTYPVNDIAPSNVTHINRNPVGVLDFVVPKNERRTS